MELVATLPITIMRSSAPICVPCEQTIAESSQLLLYLQQSALQCGIQTLERELKVSDAPQAIVADQFRHEHQVVIHAPQSQLPAAITVRMEGSRAPICIVWIPFRR